MQLHRHRPPSTPILVQKHSTWCCCRQRHTSSITTLKELCTVNDFAVHFFLTKIKHTQTLPPPKPAFGLGCLGQIRWRKKRARRKKIFRTDETPTKKKTQSLNVKKVSIMSVRAFFAPLFWLRRVSPVEFFLFFRCMICVQETH